MRTAYTMLASIFLLTLAVLPGNVAAHGDSDDGHDRTTASKQAPETTQSEGVYTFITPEGGSMSVLVRRAIQLYDQENTSISLTPAQAVYSETQLVQELGNRYLEIGEKFVVPKVRIAERAKESLGLNVAEISEWQIYADTVDFDVSSITAEPVPTAPVAETEAEEKGKDSKEEHSDKKDTKTGSVNSAIFWELLITAGVIAAVAYLARPRHQSAVTTTKPKRNTTAKKAATSTRK
jgi:hypothetical protein